MAEVNNNGILIRDVETKNIMTKSTLPVGARFVEPSSFLEQISVSGLGEVRTVASIMFSSFMSFRPF